MEVVKYPHPVLRMVCRPLRKVDAELKAMILEMFPLMYASKGVGLAANQVGLPYRFFIMNPTGDENRKDQEYVFINPEITLGAGKPEEDDEGCLSFPKIYAAVKRAPKVTITGFNLDGEPVKKVFKGFPARIVQHEFDHLNGISFVNRLSEQEADYVEDDVDRLVRNFRKEQETSESMTNEAIQKQIDELLALRAVV